MSYPIFGNLSLGNVSGNIKLFVNHSGIGNLTGIGYNNNAMTFGVNQSATDTPEMIINRIGDVDILGNVFTGGNVVVNAIAPSTSTTTGALRVAGGVGIVGNVYTGGNVVISSVNSFLQFSDNSRIYSGNAIDTITQELGVTLIDFGNRWILNNIATFTNWRDIAVSSTGQYQILAPSQSSGKPLLSIDYGMTWTIVNNVTTSNSWNKAAISATGQYIAVANNSTGHPGSIVLSSNYGGSFNNSVNPAGTVKVGYIAISGTGQYFTWVAPTVGIYNSNTYGGTWRLSITGGFDSDNWTNIAISSSGQYQVATSAQNPGSVFLSNDYGLTFIRLNNDSIYPPINTYWISCAISSTGQYISVVSGTTQPGGTGRLYTSNNYGQSWILRSPSNVDWTSISMNVTGQYQLAVISNGQIYKSTDFGNTWTLTATYTNFKGISISSSGQYITAVGSGGVYTSTLKIDNLWDNSGNDIYLNYTGNVGIGTQTNNPLWFVSNNASTINSTLASGSDVGIFYGATNPAAAGLVISPRGIGGGIKMSISGNVGIGTITPQTALDVNGTLRLNNPITQTFTGYSAGSNPASTQIGGQITGTNNTSGSATTGVVLNLNTITITAAGVWLVNYQASINVTVASTAVGSVLAGLNTAGTTTAPAISGTFSRMSIPITPIVSPAFQLQGSFVFTLNASTTLFLTSVTTATAVTTTPGTSVITATRLA